mgnify:FL=1
MPYPKREPVPEAEMFEPAAKADMNRKRWAGHHTLCQTLRDIYALTNDQDIRYKCRMAMAYSKSMHERLKYYRDKYEPKDFASDAEWLPGETVPAAFESDSPAEQSGCPSFEASSSPPIQPDAPRHLRSDERPGHPVQV